MQIARSGRARISIRRPRAMGESDRSGFWYNHADMVRQYQWAGNKLVDTGLLVGPDEVDIPQDQLRSLILPPDPRPVINARPSPNVTGVPITGQPLPTTPGNYGFQQYIINSSLFPDFPTTKSGVLNAIAAITGIPIPSQIFDRSVTLTHANTSYQVLQTEPARTWVLIYSPVNPQTQLTLALSPPGFTTAVWGALNNLIIGPGEAFWAATQYGLGAPYLGAISAIGLFPGMPLWAWEGGPPAGWLTDEFGNLLTDEYGQALPFV